MATRKDKIIPTMVTSYSHDKDLKIQYPIYTIISRSYNEISRLLEQNHTVELNDQGMIVKLDKDKLLKQIVPLYDIELEVNKVKKTVTPVISTEVPTTPATPKTVVEPKDKAEGNNNK